MLIDAKDSSSSEEKEKDDENFCKWEIKKRKNEVEEGRLKKEDNAHNVKAIANSNNKKVLHVLSGGGKGCCNGKGHPPPRKIIKVDKEQKKDNEVR